MNELERSVWAAAFVAEWHHERSLLATYDPDRGPNAFTCGEAADEAVELLRSALAGGDAEYLLPVCEHWSAPRGERR